MVNIISIRELRPKLASVIDNIHEKFDRYVVTKRGVPEVVMMSIEDFESILETLEIESDKELMKKIKKADQDLKSGKGVLLEKIHEELKRI
jgi:antitoxin YefM